MQIFFLVDGDDQHGILRVQQFFGDLQALLHHGEPFAVAIGIVAVHIVVVILPVFGSRIVRRVDVNAIDLSRIQVFQQLQRVVVVCFDQRMPQVAVRRIAYRVHPFEARVDRLPEAGDRHQIAHGKFFGRLLRLAPAFCLAVGNRPDDISFLNVRTLDGDQTAAFDGKIPERSTFRDVILENQPEFLLFQKPVGFFLYSRPQLGIADLLDQII